MLGRRIVKRVYDPDSTYVRMIYRGSTVVAEANNGGTLTLGYTSGFGVDNLVAIHRYADNSDYYVVQDALHSVRGLSRRDGTWIASWRYGIYGVVVDSAGSSPIAVRFRWTGREYDIETGLYYFRARYYDPAAQRFVQEDPIGFAGGANLYAYGNGNPTNARDPNGLMPDPATYIPPKAIPPSGCGDGPSVYIDGAHMGTGACALGWLDGLQGDGVDPMAWSPPTTVEARAAAVEYYNTVGAIEAAVYRLTLGANASREDLDVSYKQELERFRVSATMFGTPIIWYGTATIELLRQGNSFGGLGGSLQQIYRVDITVSFPNGWQFSGVGDVVIFAGDGHGFGTVWGSFFPPGFVPLQHLR